MISNDIPTTLLTGGSNDLGFKEEFEITPNLQQLHSIAHNHGAKSVALTIPPLLKVKKTI